MGRYRRSSLSLLWLIIQLSAASGNTILLDRIERGNALEYRSKRHSRKRQLGSSGKGKGSKRGNVWYRGFDSDYSAHSSRASSRLDSYDIEIQVLFPNKPYEDDTPQTPKPSQRPTKLPTMSPTLHPTNAPTPQPSKRPTPSPSENPSSLSSASPTLTLTPSESPSNFASANPSAITSESPTVSPAPTPAPSVAPSVVASNGPSASMVPSPSPTLNPSLAPSPAPSRAPSFIPSMLPSAIDSDQPTSSLLPSKAPSAMPSIIASSRPSAAVSPTMIPTLTQSAGPSNVISMMPSMMPSSDPSMGPSTTPPFETSAPSVPRDSEVLPIFTLEYQLFDFDEPTEADLVELETLTRAYLRDHIFGSIDGADALLDDFFTTYTDDEADSGALVINVDFESTAFYNPNSPRRISMNDLIEEVVNAFTGEEMDEYLERVQSLPNSNIFAGAIQIFLISQLESQNQRAILSVLLAGSGALLAILGGFGFLRYHRRKGARRQASKQFLHIISEDSTTDCSTIQRDMKDTKTDSSVPSVQDYHSNPFASSRDVWDLSDSDEFLAGKRSTYSRPRMHKFSND